MKKFLLTLFGLIMFATGVIGDPKSAIADFEMIVPQRPGGGTSIWASIVSRELEKFLGEKIRIRHIPGARDIPGFNKWHNDLRSDDRTIMVSKGGNGVSFLQEKVDYNYAEYDSVGLMNLNIIAALRSGIDPEREPVRFAAGSGQVPETFAMTMLICGPLGTAAEYVDCFKKRVVWVHGMKTAERRLAFIRGELTGTRENPAAFKKHVEPMIKEGKAKLWFHHGILDAATRTHKDDVNYPGYQFEILFRKRWGVAPSGDLYAAYKLVKSFRDGLQKALWMSKGNPHLGKLRSALEKMAASPESMAVIRKKVGNYDWIIGEAGNSQRDTLMTLISEPALRTLVKFNSEALGLASKFKPQLIK